MIDLLPIGEVARRSGVASSALRFYEQRGLISSEREGSGHRRYPRPVLRRIAFIVFAQRIGLTLDEIGVELAKLPPHHAPTRNDWARLSATWASKRIAELPDVPAIAEVVPGYAMSNWHALFGPAGLPAGIVARIQAELPKMRNDPSLVKISKAAGVDMMFTSADVLRARMEAEVPRWKKLVPAIGLQQQ